MRASLLIVDDFYPDPANVRSVALESSFSAQGTYPGIRSRPFLPDGLKETIELIIQERITLWPKGDYNGAFQIVTAQQSPWIHADYTTDWAGIVFLTPDAPPTSGTAFYRHRATGADRYPADEPTRRACIRDHRDRDRWIKTDFAANAFNRLLLFDAHRWHSAEHYFGTGLKDCRLFQVLFFNTSRPTNDRSGGRRPDVGGAGAGAKESTRYVGQT